MTITVAADYIVKANQTLHLTDSPAFDFEGQGQPTLLNRGTVTVTSSSYAWGVSGSDTPGQFINGADAVFRVVGSGAGVRAAGFGTNTYGADFRNDGLFEGHQRSERERLRCHSR